MITLSVTIEGSTRVKSGVSAMSQRGLKNPKNPKSPKTPNNLKRKNSVVFFLGSAVFLGVFLGGFSLFSPLSSFAHPQSSNIKFYPKSSSQGHVEMLEVDAGWGYDPQLVYPQAQYDTDRLYSVIAKSIARLPLRPEYGAPVALWSMGKVGYQTQVSMGEPIPYANLDRARINQQSVKNVNSYISPSSNLFVPVYQNQKLLGWVYVKVSGRNYYPSHIGYLNLARQWNKVNAAWQSKGANPRLVLDRANHDAYFTIPSLGSDNLTPVFDGKPSKPLKPQQVFKSSLRNSKK